MNLNKILVALLFGGMQFVASAQNNVLYGLLRTANPATIYLGTLDLSSGTYNQLSPTSLSTTYNATGAALDPNMGSYFFINENGLESVNLLDGLTTAENAVTNPISPSYFDNFRFNTSDSSLYGLARRYIQASPQNYGELFLSTIDPNTGVITQISPQSVGEFYALQGNAIDPHEMVYYYSTASQIIGLDMYTGLVYSAPPLSFPQGGMYFDNFTYNCADTTIYGLIRVTTSIPLTVQFGKINPQTGVVTQISQQALPLSTYSVNGSSTVDPTTGIYYCVSNTDQSGWAVTGISTQTGTVVSTTPLQSTGTAQIYFDMMRHPSDCYEAAPTRVNPNGGSAGLSNAQKAEVKVAPNPFDQLLTISAEAMIQALTLRDAQGKVVLQQTAASKSIALQTAPLQSGIYFLEVQTETGIELLKVVK
jgi:hypothetical protein